MPALAEEMGLSPEQVELLLAKVDALPIEEARSLLAQVEALERAEHRQRCRDNYLEYVKHMWPAFLPGAHIRIMANAFERIANGTLKRVILNLGPGHSKSENGSIYFPSWYLGRFPERRVIQAGHTADIATDFGSKVKAKVMDPLYKEIFPNVSLQADKKAAGHWRTNKGGEFFAVGVGGALAGRRANLLIIDDPQSEQDYKDGATNPKVWNDTYEWFISGPLTRLYPDAAVMIIQTRWHKLDLTGQIKSAMVANQRPEDWEIIEFPTIFNEYEPNEKALWPEFWPLDKVRKKREEICAKAGGKHLWNANYQQDPTSEEGAIIKREWWRYWDIDTVRELNIPYALDENGDLLPPRCEFLVQTWDTAHQRKKRSDFSACTTWGIFTPWPDTKPNVKHIILLNAFAKKLEFPDLKRKALYEMGYWKPDSLMIEAKAAGWPLIQELRAAGIPVQDYSPSKGDDKDQRINSIAELFASGLVWTPPLGWADDVVQQLAEFPNGDHDDLVDCTSLALMRFRQGGLVRLASDFEDKDTGPRRRRVADYY